MGQKKLGFGLLVSGLALTAVACGGGGSGSPAAGFTSGASLNAAMASPTGTVEAATAVGVAEAFQASAEAETPAGFRQKAQAQSASTNCPNGGSITASSSNNGNDVNGSYNNCDLGSGCVINGSVGIFGASSGSPCYSYDIDFTCADSSGTAQFSGCIDSEFGFVYLVEYDGATYKVTGSYANGSGTLTITGENGAWECTYTENAGTCTGTGGSFEFSASSASEADDDAEG